MSCTTTRRMIRSASLAEGRHENFGETGREPAKGSGHQEPAELNGRGWSPSINPNSRSGKPRRIYGDSTQPRVNERLDALSQDGASHNLSLLNEPGWALNVFWLPVSGRRACAVRSTRVSTRQSSPHPDWTCHAGTRWVTERITSPLAGEETHPNQNRNDRHERHHGHRPTRKEKTASRKRRSWLPEIFLPLDRSR